MDPVAPRSLPVMFSCKGCADYGNMACEVAGVLQARGLVEAAWLGAPAEEARHAAQARSRAPLYAIDGCAKRCALQWLSGHGARAKRHIILAAPGDTAEQIAERIASGW
jgi:uncharacterized metal-binding protein